MPLDRSLPENLRGFLGVNLRRDPLLLEPSELAQSIDADLHTRPGVVRLRKGRTSHSVIAETVRQIARHNTRLYAFSGHLWYRETTLIGSGLHASLQNALVAYQPLNDATTWVFMADKNGMRKDNGTLVRNWGIATPTVAPVAASSGAGVLTGAYRARYAYVRLSGSNVAAESALSPQSNQPTLTTANLTVTVTASTDPQVTNIRVYRTLADGSQYFLDQTVSNATATITSTQADASLGALADDDGDPPDACANCVEFQGHIFLCNSLDNPTYLWYSKRFFPEAFPTDQFLDIGTPSDPLLCAVPLSGFLGVFTRLTKYRVFGNAVSGFSYLEALNTRGTTTPNAVHATSRGVLFWARDGIFSTNFVQPDEELTQPIAPLFYGESLNGYAPVDWAQMSTFSLAEYKRRLYCGYQDTAGARMMAVYSQDTGNWYHYRHPVQSLYYDESNDAILMGGQNGIIHVLEDGDDDAGSTVSLACTLATRAGGDPFTRKHLSYFRTDIEVLEAPVTMAIYVDDALVHAVTITGNRDKKLRRLPDRLLGYTWSVRIQGACHVYGVQVLYTPVLEQA